MSSSASSSGYNSAAHSVEMDTSPSFYNPSSTSTASSQRYQQNVYAIYSPQLHIYSQNGSISQSQVPPPSEFQISPEDGSGEIINGGWTPQMAPDWMNFNGQIGFGGVAPSPYGSQQQYGQN